MHYGGTHNIDDWLQMECREDHIQSTIFILIQHMFKIKTTVALSFTVATHGHDPSIIKSISLVL
jgi:hypothetical protein